jgi:hypothetical protein
MQPYFLHDFLHFLYSLQSKRCIRVVGQDVPAKEPVKGKEDPLRTMAIFKEVIL